MKTHDVLPHAQAYVAARRAEYEEEVRAWYEEGDGRSPQWVQRLVEYEMPDGGIAEGLRDVNIGGRGYRFPRCIHGANLWVDHDIPCGACEGDDRTDDEIARDLAETILRQVNERTLWFSYKPDGIHGEMLRELIEWCYAPLVEILPKEK